ncbi:MAG: FixH family protein [Weeksellaceae bacterium]|nr:FixH family protein [Weeksellaceae bacterium]
MSNFKFDWGHGIALALGSFILFILALIFFADETGDLVSDRYYEESLTFQSQNIDAKNNANLLSSKPQIIQQANGIKILFPPEIKLDSGRVLLQTGAYEANDVRFPIKLDNMNSQLLPAARLADSADYDISLRWYSGSKPYLIEDNIRWNLP